MIIQYFNHHYSKFHYQLRCWEVEYLWLLNTLTNTTVNFTINLVVDLCNLVLLLPCLKTMLFYKLKKLLESINIIIVLHLIYFIANLFSKVVLIEIVLLIKLLSCLKS